MTKLMLKLYLDDKHVGYMYKNGEDIIYGRTIKEIFSHDNYIRHDHIKHDSFGIGIEINGTWWFPEDEIIAGGRRGTLDYVEFWSAWEVYINGTTHPLHSFYNITTGEWSIEKKEE